MNKLVISELKNDYLLILAIFKCAGENGKADPEDIAVTLDKFVKGKFRWKKYKKYIDLSLVKTLLGNARDRAKLIQGGKNGWYLTSKGKKILNNIKDKISYSGQRLQRLSKFDRDKVEFEYSRILGSQCYQNYIRNIELQKNEIRKIFRIDEYSSNDSINESAENLIKLMKGNKEIVSFLKNVRKEVLNG